MRNSALVGAGIAALLATSSAHAHHPGGAGTVSNAGPIVTISAETLAKGQSAVAVMMEATRIAAFSDSQLVNSASKHVHAHSLDAILSATAAFAYGLTNDLTASLRLPYVARSDIREGDHAHIHGQGVINEAVHRGDSEGLGDLTAMLQWRFLHNRESGTQWALLGGMKMPTGETAARDRAGERFELEFQPGTGSWDWMIGLAATQPAGAFSLSANVLYVTTGRGDSDTDLGDRLHYNLAVSYRLLGTSGETRSRAGAMYHGPSTKASPAPHDEPRDTRSPVLDLALELNGEWHDRQTIGGIPDPNSGGNVVYVAPGARLSVDRWSTFLSVGVPVVSNLNGVQAEPDYRVLSGLSVAF